jgi:hypothetical protein
MGPFETEKQARQAAATRGGPPKDGWTILSAAQRHAMLMEICAEAGVAVGVYDARILSWLSRWEDPVVAVIAGLISRANGGPANEMGEWRLRIGAVLSLLDGTAQLFGKPVRLEFPEGMPDGLPTVDELRAAAARVAEAAGGHHGTA